MRAGLPPVLPRDPLCLAEVGKGRAFSLSNRHSAFYLSRTFRRSAGEIALHNPPEPETIALRKTAARGNYVGRRAVLQTVLRKQHPRGLGPDAHFWREAAGEHSAGRFEGHFGGR